MTDTTNTIAAALAKAQAKMGKALKDSTNPAFRSKYADLGNVMDACLPALNECGISVIQPFRNIEGQNYVETILLHESGEQLSCAIPLLVNKNDMQGLGSAMTYARRYGLMCMAGIAPEDDDGNAAASAPPPKQHVKPEAQKPQERDPVAITNSLIGAIGKFTDAEALGQWPAEGTKPADAWEWIRAKHPAQHERLQAAYSARINQLTTQNADLGDDAIPH